MSYFNQINGFMDNIEQNQNAIEGFKDSGFNTQIGDLQDKYAFIKQKALEGVPDIAGDVLNYTTQGVQALSGTYSTIRALKNSKMAKSLAKKTGEPEKSQENTPEDVDENGLPKLSDLEQRLNRLKGNAEDISDLPEAVIDENLKGGVYEDLARSAVQGNIEPNSAYNQLRAQRQAEGGAPEPEPIPTRRGPAEPLVPREVDPVTGAEVRPPSPPKTRDLTDAEREIGADGFTPDERQAIETANNPAKLERNLQEEHALDTAPQPKAPAAEGPFEGLFPKPPQQLSAGEKAAQYAKTTEEGGGPGGSSLLAKVTQQGGDDKPLANPESNGVSVANEVEESASTASKLGAAADIAEGPLALAGMVAGDIKGKGAQTTSEAINDAVGVKQAYNLGRRGKRLIDRNTGEADEASQAPHTGPAEPAAEPDYAPLEEPPLDVDARIAQIRQAAQEAQSKIVTDPTNPAAAPKLQAQETAEEETSPIRSADDTPEVDKANIDPADVKPEPEAEAPEADTEAVSDATDSITKTVTEDTTKGLGQTILDTFGADSAGELALDSLGPIGEIAGVSLMLGGIFHDIFGKKAQERKQQQQEQQAQNQENLAETNLKSAQAAGGVTTGAIDLTSLHNIAGANASVGII